MPQDRYRLSCCFLFFVKQAAKNMNFRKQAIEYEVKMIKNKSFNDINLSLNFYSLLFHTPMKNIALSLCVFLLLFITGNLTKAQPANPPATADIVILAARMVEVKTGKIISNPTVFISGNRITYVGSQAKIPAKAQVVQLGEVTLLPGLIDVHTHLLEVNPETKEFSGTGGGTYTFSNVKYTENIS